MLLFDTEEQLEVRYVLSLAHHNVSIYGGGEEIPEGELFIKRNALCLTRRSDAGEMTAEGLTSKPFFLFTDNLSEKEDFYFALLKNMERRSNDPSNVPKPLQFDVKHIIDLVQRLHSSEDHMQIRWFNAILGRIFLGIYKTSDVENFIRAKITKKISRVKKPAFLSKIVLRHVDMGEGAPYITNPRLKDFTVDGDCIIETDMLYTGNFRVEIAATARIELGSRFKAREVDLVLAVTCRRIEGHMLLRVKPPPSNRLWMTFETPPRIDMSIEPIVSSRQITYNVILRQIENRIKEVIAESIVLPFWDDLAFFNTDGKLWRGGVWADSILSRSSPDLKTAIAEEGDVEGMEQVEADVSSSTSPIPSIGKSMSMPVLESPTSATFARKAVKSVFSLGSSKSNGSSTSIETRLSASEKPRAIRKHSFASPIVSTDSTNIDAFKPSNAGEYSAASTMAALSAKSPPSSATNTPVGSPLKDSNMPKNKPGSLSSNSSRGTDTPENTESDKNKDDESEVTEEGGLELNLHRDQEGNPESPGGFANETSQSNSIKSPGTDINHRNSNGSMKTVESTESGTSSTRGQTKRITLNAVANAAENARKWGLNAIQRTREQAKSLSDHGDAAPDLSQPMGRGKPLPPPGTPLPPPDRKTKTAPIPVPKRKPLPPPDLSRERSEIKTRGSTSSTATSHHLPSVLPPPDLSQEQSEVKTRSSTSSAATSHQLPPPVLPKRRSRQEPVGVDDGIFVVAAPDSEPASPMDDPKKAYLPPWVDEEEDEDDKPRKPTPPCLPRRQVNTAGGPEEGDKGIPSGMAPQEKHARANSVIVDDDSGNIHQ